MTYSGANLKMVSANRRSVVHRVESCDLVNSHRGHFQNARHLIHDAETGEAMLSLPEVQQRHYCSLFVLAGIPGKDLLDELFIGRAELEGNIWIVG